MQRGALLPDAASSQTRLFTYSCSAVSRRPERRLICNLPFAGPREERKVLPGCPRGADLPSPPPLQRARSPGPHPAAPASMPQPRPPSRSPTLEPTESPLRGKAALLVLAWAGRMSWQLRGLMLAAARRNKCT